MSTEDCRYHAFISYSHRDKRWGDWLHRALETYRVPKHLVGTVGRDGDVPPRLRPVFRDREELPTSADLGSVIDQALRDSQYLIVICSPRSAQSRWVNEEILAFKRLGRSGNILAMIVDGEPNVSDKGEAFTDSECFPEALRFEVGDDGELSSERTEPIAADARPQGDGKRDAKLKLLAGLLGVGFDAIKRRDQQRRQRRLAVLAVAAAVLLAVTTSLAVFALLSRADAVDAREDAEVARELSDQRERESRSQLIRTLEGNGHQQYNNDDVPQAMLWYAEALRVLGETVEPTAEDQEREFFARIRMKYLADAMPKPIHDIAHDDRITLIEFSRDRKLFATVSMDQTARVWHAATGEPASPPLKHPGFVFNASFSPDSKSLVTSGFNHELRVWNVADGKQKRPPVKHFVPARDPNATGMIGTTPTYYTALPDDQWMTFDQSHLHLWKINDTEAKRIWTSEQHVFMFYPDSQGIRAVVRDESGLYIWEIATRKKIAALNVKSPEYKRITFSGDGRTIVLTDHLGGLECYLAEDGRKLIGIPTPKGSLNTVAASRNGAQVVTGYEHGAVVLYNFQTAFQFGVPGGVQSQSWNTNRPVIALDMSPAYGRFLAVTDRRLLIHDPYALSAVPPRVPSGRLARWTSAETIVTSGFGDQGVGVLWHVTPSRPGVSATLAVFGDRPVVDDQEPEAVTVEQVVYDASGQRLFAGSLGRTLWRFERQTEGPDQNAETWKGKEQMRAPRGKQPFPSTSGLQITTDGNHVFAAFDGKGFLIDANATEKPSPIDLDIEGVYKARFTRDGSRMLVVANVNTLLDTATKKPIAQIPGGGVNATADISPNGRFVVSTANRFDPMSSTLRHFDGATGKHLPWHGDDADAEGNIPFQGHLADVLIAPNSEHVAVSHNGDIHFRNLETGSRMGPMLRRAGVPIAFNPDGDKLLTLFIKEEEGAKYGYKRENIGFARVWNVRTGEPVTAPMEHNLILFTTFSNDESMILTAGGEHVALWSASDGQPIVPMMSHDGAVRHAAFAPNDREIAVASDRVYIWAITPDPSTAKELVARAEVMSGKTIDQTGAAVPASNKRLREQWKTINRGD